MRAVRFVLLQFLLTLILIVILDQGLYYAIELGLVKVPEGVDPAPAPTGSMELKTHFSDLQRFPCFHLDRPRKTNWKFDWPTEVASSGIHFASTKHDWHTRLIPAEGANPIDTIATFDEAGRRRVPWLGREKRHLLFMGCSMTFGEGLNDDQTIGYYIGKLSKDHRPYLAAMPGFSANDVFAHLDSSLSGIGAEKGIALYIGIPSQLKRFAGTQGTVGVWAENNAVVVERTNGKFEFLGSWKKSKPNYVAALKILSHSGILSYTGISIPPITSGVVGTFVRLVAEIKKRYLQKFPGGHFLFVFYPGDRRWVEETKLELDKAKIEYLDYSSICPSTIAGNQAELPGDEHPSATFNEIFASILDRDLTLLKVGYKQ